MTTASLALPNIASARLPQTYMQARTALEKCSRLDECQDWANKAEALASYAKQSHDDSLRKMADRIQARAIRRCGQLLKQAKSLQGARTDLVGAHLPSRKRLAKDAGLSKDQQMTAIRVANVPEEDFEAVVESDHPPSVSLLAEAGTKHRAILQGSTRPGFAKATMAIGTLRRFAEFCAENDPVDVAAGVAPHEVAAIRKHVKTIDAWMDVFITRL